MACDRALLESVGRGAAPPTVRFYAWDPPAVSLGRHQPEPEPAAAAALEAAGIDRVRRPTGGRLVYHGPPDEELTYSVVAPLDEPVLAGGPGGAHRRIHEALAEGLARLGVAVELTPEAPRRPGLPRPSVRLACFATRVPHELVVGGRKLVGSAQRRSGRALLQHGSIPLAGDPAAVPARVWPGSLDPHAVATVSAAAGRTLGFDEVAAALAAGIEERLDVDLARGALSDAERASIRGRCAREADGRALVSA